jgi:hypothetical protein
MKDFLKLLLALALALPAGAVDIKTGPEFTQPSAPTPIPKADLPLAAAPSAALNPAIPLLSAPHLATPLPEATIIEPAAPVLPQATLPASPAQPVTAAGPEAPASPSMGAVLDTDFKELVHAFDRKRDTIEDGNSAIPDDERHAIISRARDNLAEDILSMRSAEHGNRPVLKQVADQGRDLLEGIDALMAKGEIDPRARLRASVEDPILPVSKRELRVGVYAVAADPFQWGHILIALRAIETLKLDKVIFVLAGDDPRKPNMTKVDFRHPMGKAVLERFAPFFEYSSIAVGTQHDGETNIFRILGLNPEQRMKAFYLVGGDHYRLKDKNGGPDTLPKLEANLKDPALKHDPAMHEVKAVFIQRAGAEEHVPTTIDTYFLPEVPFDASSTLVREGNHALMPWAAYQYVQEHRPGLYGIPPAVRPGAD